MTLDDCEHIFDNALASTSEAAFCHFIEPLFSEYEILSLEIGRGSIYWRARIVDTMPFPSISEMDYPPAEYAKVGRLNDAGQPCFYISARKETALTEVGATEGQKVQIAGFRILNEQPIQLAVIGEYSNVHKNGYMHFAGSDPDLTITKNLNDLPPEEAIKRIYIDKFFAHVLSDPNACKNGYLFSRALAQIIYAKNHANGIVFPSVKDRGGFNIGIKPDVSDKSFHNVCCLVVDIGKKRRFGLCDYVVTKSAENLGSDGNFIWRSDNPAGIIGIYGMDKQEFDFAMQNRNDKNALLQMLRKERK